MDITYTGTVDLTDFQVKVVVDTSSLISAGKMQSDCDDIRFTDSDGVTPINFWVEGPLNSPSTVIWVEVPHIPASSTKTIYMYYGNAYASSASDGDATFVFFDDFSSGTLDASKWKYTKYASVIEDTSQPAEFGKYVLRLSVSSATHAYAACNMPPMRDVAIRVLVNDTGTYGDMDGVAGLRWTGTTLVDFPVSKRTGIMVEHDTDCGFHFDWGATGAVIGDYMVKSVWEWQEFVAYGTQPKDHKAKHWNYGTPEPDTYSLVATSVSHTDPGLAFLRAWSGEAHIAVVTVRKHVEPPPTTTLGKEEAKPASTRRRSPFPPVGGVYIPVNKPRVALILMQRCLPWIAPAVILPALHVLARKLKRTRRRLERE